MPELPAIRGGNATGWRVRTGSAARHSRWGSAFGEGGLAHNAAVEMGVSNLVGRRRSSAAFFINLDVVCIK